MGTKTVEKPRGWLKLILGVVLSVVTIAGSAVAFLFIDDFLGASALSEMIGGILALAFVILLGGIAIARPQLPQMSLAWKLAAAIFIADGVILVIDIIATVMEGEPIVEGWFGRTIVLAIMCLGIGMVEEGVFRGLIFQGLLGVMGTSRRGVVGAIMLSSLFFGLAHIIPDGSTAIDALALGQMALKTLQTGLVGVVFCVVVLATKSLWPAIALHAINDFMLIEPSTGIYGIDPVTEYVAEGSDALYTMGLYAVLCVAYMPSVIMSLRYLKGMMPEEGRNRGAFWVPKYPQAAMAAPMQQAYAQQMWQARQQPMGSQQFGYAPAYGQQPQQQYPSSAYPQQQTAQAAYGGVPQQQPVQQQGCAPAYQQAQQLYPIPENYWQQEYQRQMWGQQPISGDIPVPPERYLESLGMGATGYPQVPQPPRGR